MSGGLSGERDESGLEKRSEGDMGEREMGREREKWRKGGKGKMGRERGKWGKRGETMERGERNGEGEKTGERKRRKQRGDWRAGNRSGAKNDHKPQLCVPSLETTKGPCS